MSSEIHAFPEGWSHSVIQSVCSSIFDGPFGSKLKSDDYSISGVLVARLENIGRLKYDSSKKTYISTDKLESLRSNALLPGDILFSSFVDEEIRVCLLPDLRQAVINKADCFCLRINPYAANQRFIMYALATRSTYERIRKSVHGATRPRINLTSLREFSIPLAPLAEQKVIADKLDALLAQVDTLKARLDAIPAILKRFRQSVLSAAVTGQLLLKKEESSISYSTQPIIDLVSEPLRNGKSVVDGEGYLVLRLSCLKKGSLDYGESKRGAWGSIDPTRYQVKPGDFLVARGNGSRDLVGRGGLASGDLPEIAFPDTMIRIRPNQAVLLPRFLSLIWESIYVREQLESAAKTTAGIWKLSQSDIESVTLPVPTLTEQTKIVRHIESLLAFADQIEARTQEASASVNHLTQSILAKAFRGELTEEWRKVHPELVSGKNSAEALLERIRATRVTAATSTPRGRKPGARSTSSTLAETSPHLLAAEAPRRRGRPRKA